MTSARSYKAPMSSTNARAELQRCAGTQFDPEVVRAMMNISLGRLWRAMGPMAWAAQVGLFPDRSPRRAPLPARSSLRSCRCCSPGSRSPPNDPTKDRTDSPSQASLPSLPGRGTTSAAGGGRSSGRSTTDRCVTTAAPPGTSSTGTSTTTHDQHDHDQHDQRDHDDPSGGVLARCRPRGTDHLLHHSPLPTTRPITTVPPTLPPAPTTTQRRS